MINIKNELRDWLVDYITTTVNSLESIDSTEKFNEEFNNWAKSFNREEAEFVVDMEYINDWGYDERNEITEKEANEYAQTLLRVVLDNWHC